MKVCRLLFVVIAAWAACAQVDAAIITAEFVRAEVPPNSTTATVPFLLNAANDILFLKFKIPNFDQIATINYIAIDVLLYDDDDGGGESGRFQFALPGANLDLGGFAANIRPATAANPIVVPLTVCECEISQVLPSLQDGNFRIRVIRDSGDFIIDEHQGMAYLDVTFVPEPSTYVCCAAGLFLIAAVKRKSLLRR